MDVSVIIVNWNVKPLLRQCLASLRKQQGVDFEVLVVDNASSDGSVEMVTEEFPEYTLIASNTNLGFAAANNMAIEHANGDFVLLLNPDTELIDTHTLAKLVRYMKERPHVGIVGPRLLNPDRTLQRSIRRFPTFVSQVLIMLKLHHIFPRLKSLREYFAADIDHMTGRTVDQVMGACFMIRGDVLCTIGNLDERFFIWFEEVDYCKRAIDAGFQVCYTPHIEVVHHGGESFDKVFGPTKQQYFNTSLRKYFRKHHGRVSAALLSALVPVSQVLAWAASSLRDRGETGGTFRTTFRSALLFIVLFEIFSFLGFLYPAFSTIVFFVLLVLATVLAVRHFEVAVLLLLAELFIGSQGGYLVSAGAGSGVNVSLRLGLFLVIFTVWTSRNVLLLLRKETRVRAFPSFRAMHEDRVLVPLLALLGVFAVGVVHGALRGNGFGNIFFDANGYAFFALFPVLYLLLSSSLMRVRTIAVLAAAIFTSVAKALFTLFIFSHRIFFVASPLYVWIRDTRVGEITFMTGDFYRIFFQAHLFALVSSFLLLLLLLFRKSLRDTRGRFMVALFVAVLTGLLMGLSRSFWFGGFVAILAMFGFFLWARIPARTWRGAVIYGVSGMMLSVGVISLVYVMPFPKRGADVSFASLFGSRAFSLAGEAAANSRWALLPKLNEAGMKHPFFGSGLGTTVTYTTSDPRLLADIPTGEYTTFAFEWGYHDLWVKFGLLGLVVYAWFIASVLRPIIGYIRRERMWYPQAARDGLRDTESKRPLWAVGVVLGIIALTATNVFSPYLNHPLGIGILALVASYASVVRHDSADSRNAG